LCQNENNIENITEKHKAKCGELEQANPNIAKIESIDAKKSKKYAQQQSRFELMTSCPLTADILIKSNCLAIIQAIVARYVFGRIAWYLQKSKENPL
jgi:hypothetical protein